jgi:hypothetical protein
LYFTRGAYDPIVGEVVVFGGGSEAVDQNTTWTWDGTTWKQRHPSVSPPARELFGTVWDPARHEFLIFGGDLFSNGKLYSDTWKLSKY